MATSFRFELDPRDRKDGAVAVYIRITQDRIRKKVKTDVMLRKRSDWNPKASRENWVRTSDPDYTVKNTRLKEALDEIRRQYDEQRKKGTVSIQKVAQEYKKADVSPSFVEYAQSVTDELKVKGEIRSAKKYQDFTNKMKSFKPHVTFADIDTAFIHKFETHLLTLPNQRHPDRMLSVSAVQVQLKTFRAILNRAKNIHKIITQNPFDGYKIHQGDKPVKDKLTREELDALNALDITPDSPKWHTRNAFMFSFYCAGIRVGDLIQLRWNNILSDGRLSYVMHKNGKIREMILVRQAKDILALYEGNHKPEDYIFPFLDNSTPWFKYITHEQRRVMPVAIKEKMYAKTSSVNTLLNKYLKQMEEEAGLQKHISFHVSRHSFAYQATTKAVGSMAIMKALAHSSLKTTETYLGELNDDETNSVLQRMFDNKPDKEKLLKDLVSLSDQEYNELLKEVAKQRMQSGEV